MSKNVSTNRAKPSAGASEKKRENSDPAIHGAVNASLIHDAAATFLIDSLASLPAQGHDGWLLLTEDNLFLPQLEGRRLDFTAIGLDEVPIRFDVLRERIVQAAGDSGAGSRIVVDMRWGLRNVSAGANFERWGTLCDQIVSQNAISVVSVYARSLLIEEQLIAALRGHSHFLAPSGIYANPYWLPPEYLNGASLSQQAAYLLQRLVPDYAGFVCEDEASDPSATGADPHWLTRPRRIRPRAGSDEIWKIRCFGRLRIYLSDGSQIRWAIPGSAPKKSKALFAYLLQRGERGANVDELAALLWMNEHDESLVRSRLHHTVAMLRKTLGKRDYIERRGDYYNLVPPSGTWIDIASFEQLCNRAKVLAKSGRDDEAITLLDAADRLYTGELFEDLLPEYVESEIDDWVIPRRTWFKEMALKVLRDKAEILRRQHRLREALECCQKALAMDPACEIAHAEAMRIFCAQGRPETITRQFRQYCLALQDIGARTASAELTELHQDLVKESKYQ